MQCTPEIIGMSRLVRRKLKQIIATNFTDYTNLLPRLHYTNGALWFESLEGGKCAVHSRNYRDEPFGEEEVETNYRHEWHRLH